MDRGAGDHRTQNAEGQKKGEGELKSGRGGGGVGVVVVAADGTAHGLIGNGGGCFGCGNGICTGLLGESPDFILYGFQVGGAIEANVNAVVAGNADEVLVVLAEEGNDVRALALGGGSDGAAEFETCRAGHGGVEYDDVRLEFAEDFGGQMAVVGGTQGKELWRITEDVVYSVEKVWILIHGEDSDGAG